MRSAMRTINSSIASFSFLLFEIRFVTIIYRRISEESDSLADLETAAELHMELSK
jgi:hypothetical protein